MKCESGCLFYANIPSDGTRTTRDGFVTYANCGGNVTVVHNGVILASVRREEIEQEITFWRETFRVERPEIAEFLTTDFPAPRWIHR